MKRRQGKLETELGLCASDFTVSNDSLVHSKFSPEEDRLD